MIISTTSAASAILGITRLNPITAAISTIYAISGTVNDFINEHIEVLKRSDNPTIASTGRVLEAAKFGFGLGYLSSVAVIAVGQLILGNTLMGIASAAVTIGSAVTLANPIAMTCGAIGAICYGWGALTEQERDAILMRVQEGLEIGLELIKSLIDFVIRKTKEFLDSKHLAELKEFIGTQAARFGRTLSDVTKATSDKIAEAIDKTVNVGKDVADAAAKAGNLVADTASQATDVVTEKISGGINKISETALEAKQALAEKMKK
jgi:hypothetical protein